MFTTIKNLRNSPAQQSRVSTVENYLHSRNPGWTADMLFPIFVIAHSNVIEDVDWVLYLKSTHAPFATLEQAVLEEFGHTTAQQHRDFIEGRFSALPKSEVLEELTRKYAAAWAKSGVTQPAPFSIGVAPAETTEGEFSKAVPEHAATTATFETAAPVVSNERAESPVEEKVFTALVSGALYIGLGKVMMGQNMPFDEAVRFSASPEGEEVFFNYVHAFASGVEMNEVADALRAFAANLK